LVEGRNPARTETVPGHGQQTRSRSDHHRPRTRGTSWFKDVRNVTEKTCPVYPGGSAPRRGTTDGCQERGAGVMPGGDKPSIWARSYAKLPQAVPDPGPATPGRPGKHRSGPRARMGISQAALRSPVAPPSLGLRPPVRIPCAGAHGRADRLIGLERSVDAAVPPQHRPHALCGSRTPSHRRPPGFEPVAIRFVIGPRALRHEPVRIPAGRPEPATGTERWFARVAGPRVMKTHRLSPPRHLEVKGARRGLSRAVAGPGLSGTLVSLGDEDRRHRQIDRDVPSG